MKKTFAFCFAAILLMLSSCNTSSYKNPYADQMKWWSEARYGMFIHWGISSLEGIEISWARKNYGPEKYDSLALRFNPSQFDADNWVKVAQDAGMKYMVLTTVHHDGFCLWDTKSTDHNIMNTPYGKDICRQFADAAHNRGMRFGWYFSMRKWNDPDCSSPDRNDVFLRKMKTQLQELLTNYGKIDLLWFDFEGWPCPTDPQELFDYVHGLSPETVINNRAYPIIPDESHAYVGSCGMYATPEQFVGGYGTVPWETCSTSSTSRQWSIRYNDPPRPAEDLIWETIGAAGGNGNMLMNVGPDSLGVILPEYADRLAEVGKWINAHEDIIYGTTCGPWKPCREYVSTMKGRTAWILLNEGGSITLPYSSGIKISSASVEGTPIDFSIASDQISFTIPDKYLGQRDVAIRLELSKAIGKNFTPLSPFSKSGSLAYDKPSKASSSLSDYYMHCPSSAFDDDERTFWRPGRNCGIKDNDLYGRNIHYKSEETVKHFNSDATLEVDLKENKTVSSFLVIMEDDKTTGEFSLEFKDGDKWIQAASADELQKEWSGDIQKSHARYWRLVIKGGHGSNKGYYGIREFRLF